MRRLALSLAVLIIFVVLNELFVGWDELLRPWLLIDNPIVVLGPCALLALSYLVRTLRVYRYFGFKRGFGAMLRLLLQHNAWVVLLPMRAGELAFPVLMRRYFVVPVERSVPALLWLRLMDFHTLILALLVTLSLVWRSTAMIAITASWAAVLLACLFLARRLSRAQPEFDPATRVAAIRRSILSAVPPSAGRVAEDWGLTAANWLLKLLAFGWIIQVFASLRYHPSLLGAVGGELSSIMPINGLAGFGTYEAGAILAMQTVGVAWESALTGAVNLHFISLGTAIVAALFSQLVPLHARAGGATPAARTMPRAAHPRAIHVNQGVQSGRTSTASQSVRVEPVALRRS